MPTAEISIAAGGDDGHAAGSGASFPPGWSNTNTTATTVIPQKSIAGNHLLNVGLLRFDTSVLPSGVVVTSAVLRLRGVGKWDDDSRSLVAEWYLPTFGPGPAPADYSTTVVSDAHAGTAIAALVTGADNDLALLDAADNINKSGYTGLRLHVTGAEATGDNYFQFASFDHATLDAPRLIVEYEAQEIRPDATSAAGNWTAQPSGSLHANTADDDDATYDDLNQGDDPSTMVLALADASEPVAGDGAVVIRLART